jgi:hypothetical protein
MPEILAFLKLAWADRKQIAYGLVIASLVGFGFHLGRVWDAHTITALKAQEQANIAAAITGAQRQCADNDSITWDIGDAYEKDLPPIRNRVAADLQRLPAQAGCDRVPTPHPASGHHAAAEGAERPRYCGTDLRPVFAVAGQCDEYRAQVKALQNFIRAERKP